MSPLSLLSCCVVVSLLAVLAAAEQQCACAAIQQGWTLDCSNTNQMSIASQTLVLNNCGSSCNSVTCASNYQIIQAHHDYCPDGSVTVQIEDQVHQYEAVCTHCSISRKPNPALPSCPTASCSDHATAAAAVQALRDNNCGTTCSATACQNNFRLVREIHDTCPEGTLVTADEDYFHSVEPACDPYDCNTSATANATCDAASILGPATAILLVAVLATVAMMF